MENQVEDTISFHLFEFVRKTCSCMNKENKIFLPKKDIVRIYREIKQNKIINGLEFVDFIWFLQNCFKYNFFHVLLQKRICFKEYTTRILQIASDIFFLSLYIISINGL